MPNAAINGIDVHYEVLGEGPPLLFLNGSASTIDDMRALIGAFTGNFQVAVADSRGLGGTEIPDEPYAMADLAADAIGLADLMGWDRFNLAGVSFGGMVAQEVAVTGPERIERLVLMCTSSGGEGGSSYPLHELASLEPAERGARMTLLADSRFTPEWLAEHPREMAMLQAMATRPEPTPESLRGQELQYGARATHDVFGRLPRITSPTFVAAGRFDGIAPPENATAIAAQIPSAQVHLYEGGHGFFVQDPTALPEILAFLAKD